MALRGFRGVVMVVAMIGAGMMGACGGALPPLPPLPSQGGPAWIELKSANFVLWTSSSPELARRTMNAMEQRREILLGVMKRAVRPTRIFAIMLRSRSEMASFLPPQFDAFAWPKSNPSYQPGIAFSAESETSTISHELAHAISYALVKNQPAWFSEGLASYFEMANPEPGARTVPAGYPRPESLVVVHQNRILSADELFACKEVRCKTLEFYATSWVVFSYLLNVHHDRFGRYMKRLDEVPDVQHEQVWREIFPDLTPRRLDAALEEWLYSGGFAVLKIPVPTSVYPTTKRPLGDADVLTARGLLHLIGAQRDKALAEADAAIAADRTHPIAWMISLWLRDGMPLAVAREIAAARPDDWRAWLLVSKMLDGQDQAIIDKICTLSDKDAEMCTWGPAPPDPAATSK